MTLGKGGQPCLTLPTLVRAGTLTSRRRVVNVAGRNCGPRSPAKFAPPCSPGCISGLNHLVSGTPRWISRIRKSSKWLPLADWHQIGCSASSMEPCECWEIITGIPKKSRMLIRLVTGQIGIRHGLVCATSSENVPTFMAPQKAPYEKWCGTQYALLAAIRISKSTHGV